MAWLFSSVQSTIPAMAEMEEDDTPDFGWLGHDETYCSNTNCDCHTSVGYHQAVTDVLIQSPDNEQIQTATSFLSNNEEEDEGGWTWW